MVAKADRPTATHTQFSGSIPFYFCPEGEIIEQLGDIDHLGSNDLLEGHVVSFDHLFMKESPEHFRSAAVHQSSTKADHIMSKHAPKTFLKGGVRGEREWGEGGRGKEREG